MPAKKPELGCREEEGAADGGGTTNAFGEASVAKPGDGGGSHEHIRHGREQARDC